MSVDEKPDSPMYVYESTVHCANILLGLNDQRKKDILCDVTLIVERKEFRAHRAVLAACSEYFWQALVGQTKDDLVVSLPEEVWLFGVFCVVVTGGLLTYLKKKLAKEAVEVTCARCHVGVHVTPMLSCRIVNFCVMHLCPQKHECKASVLL